MIYKLANYYTIYTSSHIKLKTIIYNSSQYPICFFIPIENYNKCLYYLYLFKSNYDQSLFISNKVKITYLHLIHISLKLIISESDISEKVFPIIASACVF